MEKKLKYFIFLLISLFIICGILFIFVFNKNNKLENLDDTTNINESQNDKEDSEITKDEFYTVKFCIDAYYQNIDSINQVGDNLKSRYIEKIENILYKYDDNINERYKDYKYTCFRINNMSSSKKDKFQIYFVEGEEYDLHEKTFNSINLMVILDKKNNTFNIITKEYLENNNISSIDKFLKSNSKLEEIKMNEENKYINKVIDEKQNIRNLFFDFQFNIKNNLKKAYESIDETYRNIKFSNYSEFKKYISDNYNDLEYSSIKKCSTDKNEKYNEYIVYDSNKLYLIFREYGPMKYKVLLDSYTVDINLIKDSYNNYDSEAKAARAIKVFSEMLSRKDYKSAYECLNETFAKNNFNSLESFKQYCNDNFYEKHDFNVLQTRKENDLLILNIEIVNKNDNSQSNIKNFIVKLEDDMKFKLSYNVDE